MTTENKRILHLVLVLATCVTLAGGATFHYLYATAIESQRDWLLNTAKSWARLIEAVARHEEPPSGGTRSVDRVSVIMSQIVDAHAHYKGFGQTGEFTLAKREADQIVFLLDHRQGENLVKKPKPVPIDSGLAAPMQRALSGTSGAVIGPDYKGVTVLAAYEPVAELGLGLVVKMDLEEIRAPYVALGIQVILVGVLFILLGVWLFLRITKPLIRSLRKSEEELLKAQEIAHLGNWEIDIPSRRTKWSDELYRMYGYRPGEIEASFEMFLRLIHPDDREAIEEYANDLFAGKRTSAEFDFRIVRPDGEKRTLYNRLELFTDTVGRPLRMVGVNYDITERKHAEEALRKEKEKAQKYLDIAGVMLIALNKTGEIILLNQHGCRILGVTEEEALGKNWFDHFLPKRMVGEVKKVFGLLMAGRMAPVEYYENSVLTADGAERDIAFHNSLLVDKKGDVVGLLSSGEDITKRKRAEEELLAAQRYARNLIESSLDIIISVDKYRRIVEFNKAAERSFGYAKEEVVGEPVEMLYEEQGTPSVEDLYTKGRFRGEVLNRRKDGTEFPALLSASHLYDEGGDFVGAMGVSRDISEQKEWEAALRKSEGRFRAVAESANDAIITINATGRVSSWNKTAEKEFGYLQEEILGRPLTVIIPERYRTAHEEGLKRVGGGGEQRVIGRTVELEGLRRDGTEFPMEISLSAWETEGERFYTAILHDITSRKMAEDALMQSHRELEVAFRELQKTQEMLVRSGKLASIGTLSAGVAHEILNPLNIIGAVIQLMQLDETLTDENREHMEEIMTQVRRATKITNNLKMFAFQKKSEYGPVDIHALFEKTAALVEEDLKLDNIVIEREFGDDISQIEADEDKLAQVFLNLLNNAKDALRGKKDGVISVSTKSLGDEVEIRFADNGSGLSQEELGKIFDPFYTTKEPGQGTGLGLSIVFSIVESHEGTIHVASEEGNGTTFTITVPFQRREYVG